MRKRYTVCAWTKNMKGVYILNFHSLGWAKRIANLKFWQYAKVTDRENMETKYYVGITKTKE